MRVPLGVLLGSSLFLRCCLEGGLGLILNFDLTRGVRGGCTRDVRGMYAGCTRDLREMRVSFFLGFHATSPSKFTIKLFCSKKHALDFARMHAAFSRLERIAFTNVGTHQRKSIL